MTLPSQSSPSQLHAVEDRRDGRLVVAFAIGILNAQKEFSAVAAGVQPIEKRGARPPDMQISCRGGGKAYDRRAGCWSRPLDLMLDCH